MDRTVDVRTPESIAFSYELAGLGSRFLAILVDAVVQMAIAIALVFGLAALSLREAISPVAGPSAKDAAVVVEAVFAVVVFLIFFGYFIAFEALWNGQTPGKRLVGIRVVRDGGFPIDFGASLIRNVLRVAEASLGFYALSAVSALVSSENKRLGDIAAGTLVVRDGGIVAPRAADRDAAVVYAATAYLTGEERALIKRFIERRDALPPQRRFDLAESLANRVRDRLPPELQRLDPESLIERL